jgi:hypothetical protein
MCSQQAIPNEQLSAAQQSCSDAGGVVVTECTGSCSQEENGMSIHYYGVAEVMCSTLNPTSSSSATVIYPPSSSNPIIFPPSSSVPFIFPPSSSSPIIFPPSSSSPIIYPPSSSTPIITGGGSVFNGTNELAHIFLDGVPGGYWYSFTDLADGGYSSIFPTNDEFEYYIMVDNALQIEYDLDSYFIEYPYVAVAFDWIFTEVGAPKQSANLSGHTSLCISYQGSGFAVNMTQTNQVGFDTYTYAVTSSSLRTVRNIPFSSFSQEGWGTYFPRSLAYQEALQIQFKPGTSGYTGTTTIYQIGFDGECN